MKIALLHLDLTLGPEKQNLKILVEAIQKAAAKGADWIITPETALQGYFFSMGKNIETEVDIPIQPNDSVKVLCDCSREQGVTLFLGCAEQDAITGKCYNSCLVIDKNGEIIGRHWKMHSHGGESEAWSSHGEKVECINCSEMMAGILICADSWFMEHSEELKEKGADVIMIPALWPPGVCGPGDCWERCSLVSGLPVWVCNQTGNNEILDMTQAESAVVVNGSKLFSYSGEQSVILIFDWDPVGQTSSSKSFDEIHI